MNDKIVNRCSSVSIYLISIHLYPEESDWQQFFIFETLEQTFLKYTCYSSFKAYLLSLKYINIFEKEREKKRAIAIA